MKQIAEDEEEHDSDQDEEPEQYELVTESKIDDPSKMPLPPKRRSSPDPSFCTRLTNGLSFLSMCTITLKPFSLNNSGTYTTAFSVIFSLFLTIICLIFVGVEINKYGSHDEMKTYKIDTSDFSSSDTL